MKRLYLAGPMRGYPEYNYPLFNRVARKLRDEGYFVLNPAEIAPSEGSSLKDYIMVDLQWIASHADVVAFLPGWEKSTGAGVEHALAIYLNKEIIYLETGL